MTLFTNIAAVIILSIICTLHILNFVLPNLYSKILSFVNIALHIALLIPLLLESCEMADITLSYMISVFVYTLSAFVSSLVRRQRDDL